MINVVILGRPNVGKSTLFNRLVGKRKSIVEATPGVTRDISMEIVDIDGLSVCLYDTGGLLDKSDDTLNDKVREKSLEAAFKQADILMFVVDAKESHPDDIHFLNRLRKTGKPIILTVNKVDVPSHEKFIYEFQSFGVQNIVPISAEHGVGIGDLLEKIEEIASTLGIENKSDRKEEDTTIAIVGKPNAGKSTLLNTLLGEDRSIVSDIAGTTRDSIDVKIDFMDSTICLVDTAGMRKKKNVSDDVEYYSVNRAVKAIETSDVCILMLDVEQGLTDQDKTIASLIVERRKGIVIAANKWDIRDKEITWDSFETYMKEEFPVLNFAMYTRVCAKREADAKKLLSLALRVAKTRKQQIETHALTDMMVRATREYTITAGNTPFKIYYVTQIGNNPPMFAVFCNHPDKLNEHYKRYLENRFREMFDFRGTPIVLQYRKRTGEKK